MRQLRLHIRQLPMLLNWKRWRCSGSTLACRYSGRTYNTIITGKGKPLTVETNETENALKDGTSKLEYVAISGELSSKQGIYTNADFAQATGNLTNQEFSWTGKYVGTLDGGKDLSADSFFTKTDYKGAVKSGDDWTSGWTL